jgi:hypothetical protein
MAADFLLWSHRRVPNGCKLMGLENDKARFKIDKGTSRATDFPSDACYKMNPEFPDNTRVTDLLENRSAQILVSERVADFLAARELPNVEYLPVAILDHRDRRVPGKFVIVHPVGSIDLLDLDACQVTADFTGKSIEKFERFVVRPDVTALPELFRITKMSHYLAVQRGLAEALLAAGFTGMGFLEPAKLEGKTLDRNLHVE